MTNTDKVLGKEYEKLALELGILTMEDKNINQKMLEIEERMVEIKEQMQKILDATPFAKKVETSINEDKSVQPED